MTKTSIVAAALAVLALSIGAAQANTKGPSAPPKARPVAGNGAGQQHAGGPKYYDPFYRHHRTKCYWLPTMANGAVTGLEQKCIWVKM
jgi:hypothetical protein